MILCVETMIRHFHLVSMLLQWYHLVLGVQLVISTTSLGTLICRSFRVLVEVSSIGTAGTAEYVPGTWYLVRSDN
mgnify:CR=1 FL=1